MVTFRLYAVCKIHSILYLKSLTVSFKFNRFSAHREEKMHRLTYMYLVVATFMVLLLMNGCKGKKIAPPPKREKEIFPGVLETSRGDLNRGTRGGSMIRADILEYDTLNVVTTRSRSLYNVLKLVFEGLLSLNPITGEIQGSIAKDFEVINEGHSILLHLNDNVFFSDGQPCTTEDVLFTFEEIYMNPDVDTKKTDVLKIRDKTVGITAVDEGTIRFDLPLPYRPFLYTLAHIEILPKHILGPLIESAGIEAFNREWGNLNGETGNVIGTGPYYIKGFQNGELLRLARNPHYEKKQWSLAREGMPYLDEIIELLDIDDETKLLKFQIGEIDFYDVKDVDIASGNLEILLENRHEGRYTIYSAGYTLASNHFLLFNQNPVAVDEKKRAVYQSQLFRKAISHLIDRVRIVNEVYKGYAYLDSSPERDVSPFYTKRAPLPHDPAAAAELFSRLDLKDRNNDGYLELPSGDHFSFTILTNEDNPLRVKMAEMISENLKNGGIHADVAAIDYNALVTKLLDTFDWEAVIIGVEGTLEPNDAAWIWESGGPLHIWAPYLDTPQTDWEKRIDTIFALGRTTWDFNRAKAYYAEYQSIVAEQLPVINILIPAQLYGFRNDFDNVVPSAVTYNAIGIIPFLYRKHDRER